jgi:hypothetical protein
MLCYRRLGYAMGPDLPVEGVSVRPQAVLRFALDSGHEAALPTMDSIAPNSYPDAPPAARSFAGPNNHWPLVGVELLSN